MALYFKVASDKLCREEKKKKKKKKKKKRGTAQRDQHGA